MRKVLTILLLFCTLQVLSAQSLEEFFGFPSPLRSVREKRVEWLYDIRFKYNFDNREYDLSQGRYSPSQTLHTATLTPLAGLQLTQSKSLSHKLMFGIDITKNMGEYPVTEADRSLVNWKMFDEILMYYRMQLQAGETEFLMTAGVFSRDEVDGKYTTAFISDYHNIIDRNLEGLLLQLKRPQSYYEIGCDWTGMIGSMRREQFLIFSYGQTQPLPWLSAGWRLSATHYANALEYGGVVDNILLEPFLKAGIPERKNWKELSMTLGWLQGAHQDRKRDTGIRFPGGLQMQANVQYRSLGANMLLYHGKTIMPFFDLIDSGGFQYGTDLYWGDPFYRLYAPDTYAHSHERGTYGRLEGFWQPHISDFLDLRLSCLVHFTGEMNSRSHCAGWQQKLSLFFSLDRRSSGRKTQPSGRTRLINGNRI